MGVRHVDGGAFIAHINDADTFCIQTHPDRHDVTATQAEHPVNTTRLEQACDQCCGGVVRNGHADLSKN